MNYTPHKLKVLLNSLGINVHAPGSGLLYKYSPFETALKIIEGSCLMFTQPGNFNDPFDMINFLVDKSCTEEEIESWVERVGAEKEFEQKKEIKGYLSGPDKVKEMIDKALEKQKSISGVTCFSKSHLKTLMWSHYADKHSGICLGFDLYPVNRADNNLMIMSVSYVKSIRRLNFFKDRDAILFHWLFTKSHVWEYEDEVRAFFSDRNGLIPFEKRCLREVYFGVRTNKEQKEAILAALRNNGYQDVKVSSLVISENTFDLATA